MFKAKAGYINQNKVNAVFCVIVCKEGKPYRKSGLEGVNIPLVLMQMRWNGQLGFPGGKVDEEDKDNGIITQRVLKEVVIRELQEEINLSINVELDDLKPLMTLLYEKYIIHSFIYEVNYETMLKIYKDTVNADNIMSENSGSVVLQLADYGDKGGTKEVLKNNFCATSKQELLGLIRYLKENK